MASSTRAAGAVVLTTLKLRPARLAAGLRHRFAERSWYRRAVFRPWFVSDAVALSGRATHGLLAAQRQHVDTKTAGRAMVADDPRAVLAALRCAVVVIWGAT